MTTDQSRPLAVLTGASSGIGAALAPVLARDGYDLLLIARRERLLDGVAARVHDAVPAARVECLALDLRDDGAARTIVDHAPDARLLVNNAGFGIVGRAIEADDEEYRRMIGLNITALTELTLAYARRMKRGDVIVNVASMAGLVPVPYQCVYAATKAYVVSFSEALQYELRDRGIHVLAYCPGPTLTESYDVEGSVSEDLAKGRRIFFHTSHEVATRIAHAARVRSGTRVPGVLNKIATAGMALFGRSFGRWAMAKAYEPVVRARDAKAALPAPGGSETGTGP